ncbi:MAG: BREX-1 system adenine-specific DNA-methyltransferase PglX, partial [Massilibacteroides sp.]|nr:BREX-1 system adenine-specific DNA-methyltransferase PglX [Massilibacteroides sp.]
MTVLEKSTRNQLDKAVQAARRAATAGADRALRALAVDQEKKPAHLTPEQAELRRRLRVRCRGLGSWQDLVRAVAYEQWHRMLFARFLAENDLLIHPEYHAPVTLEECAEIARDRGLDPWEVAAEYAAGMLPGIFQQDDPLLLLKYAPEDRAALQEILTGIPAETFRTQDALGWTYQFWQTEEKATVNKSGKKIEGADICAVTQLFTEPYMVQFLLQNTLGAWWLDRHPESPLRSEWVYYKDQVHHDFSDWPESPAELKILDPCCGSGHFLVEAFHMLLVMRRELGEEIEAAIRGIVRNNLHGLEIDPRCIQIATFSIALEAWKAGFSPTESDLPVPNLACTGIPVKAEKEEWLRLAGGDGLLEGALAQYYDLFKNADTLGSLIQVDNQQTLVDRATLAKKFEQALRREKEAGDPVAETFGETGHGVLKAAGLLSGRYDYVLTNVPYLSSGKQGDLLKSFIEEHHPRGKNDIATAFLERCLSFCRPGAKVSIVLPQNWLFLRSYRRFREHLLKNERWDLLARLGPGSFETISGEVVKAIILNISRTKPPEGHLLCGLDVSEERDAAAKARSLLDAEMTCVEQAGQLENSDAIVQFRDTHNVQLLEKIASCYQGTSTGDKPQFVRSFYEFHEIQRPWQLLEDVPEKTTLYSGKTSIINWDGVNNFPGSAVRGGRAFEQNGISIGQMSRLPTTLYIGYRFSDTTPVIISPNEKHLPALWAFCSTSNFAVELRKINQKLSVNNGYVSK